MFIYANFLVFVAHLEDDAKKRWRNLRQIQEGAHRWEGEPKWISRRAQEDMEIHATVSIPQALHSGEADMLQHGAWHSFLNSFSASKPNPPAAQSSAEPPAWWRLGRTSVSSHQHTHNWSFMAQTNLQTCHTWSFKANALPLPYNTPAWKELTILPQERTLELSASESQVMNTLSSAKKQLLRCHIEQLVYDVESGHGWQIELRSWWTTQWFWSKYK